MENVEEASKLIVVGTFTKDAWQNELFADTFISYNDIKITKVLKGDIKAGDTITIGQHYGIKNNRFITDSELTPMMKGDAWYFS